MDGFRYNPSAGSSGGNLKVLPPEKYNNLNVVAVELVGPDGRVIDRGRYMRVADGRKNYRFSKPGWAYPANVRVRVVTSGGGTEYFNPRDGIKSHERGPSAPPLRGSASDSEENNQDAGGEDQGFGGGPTYQEGENFGSVTSEGGTDVYTPNFVDFNPEDYFINLDEAINYGRAEGQHNLGLFRENFDRGKEYALETQQTELEGLESFLPRTSRLIRQADAEGNRDILGYSDVFDARNERAMRRATLGNVALRKSIVEQEFPGTFDVVQGMRTRAEGDVKRVREREKTSFIDNVMTERAARDARARGADIASSTGFGADSSAGMDIMDKFDVNRRLELEQLKREDFRRGDAAIYTAEGQIGNAVVQSQNLFNTVIAPGIRDFTPIQPTPRVTDIGAQIRPMPSVDAGSLQREYTNQQNNVSMLAPSQVFSGSIDTQKYNSGVGLQALGFMQDQFNTIAGAANQGADIDRGEQIFQQQMDAYNEGLDIREQSQNIQSGIGIATGIGGVIGGLINGGSNQQSGNSSSQSGGSSPQSGGGSSGGVGGFLTGIYNGFSDFLEGATGLDIGQIGGGSSDSNTPSPRSGAGSGLANGQVIGGASGDTFDIGSSEVPGTGQTVDQRAQATAQFEQGMNSYNQQILANDWNPQVNDQDFDLGSESFDWGVTQEGYQPTEYNFSGINFESFEARSSGDNEYVNLAKVSRESSGVEVIPKREIVESFADSSLRNSVMVKTGEKGLPTATMLEAYNLYDNWKNMSEIDRAAASASLLNNIANSMEVGIEGVPVGAAINTIRQSANLLDNWSEMSDGQKTKAGASIVGSIGSMAATMAGVGGPVGAAIAFGAAALGQAGAVIMDRGIDGKDAFTTVLNPFTAYGANMINNFTGNNFHQNDVNNAALAASGPIGWGVMAADMVFGLDLDFTSGKPKTQQFRDALRGHMQNVKILDQNYQIKLSDGSFFDMGKDGKAKLKNVGKNIDGKTERHYYDVDFSNPIAGEVTGWANVLSRLGFRSNEGSKMVGYFVNAATSKDPTNLALAKENMKGMAMDFGLNYNEGIKILDALKPELSDEEYAAFRNGWMNLMLK